MAHSHERYIPAAGLTVAAVLQIEVQPHTRRH